MVAENTKKEDFAELMDRYVRQAGEIELHLAVGEFALLLAVFKLIVVEWRAWGFPNSPQQRMSGRVSEVLETIYRQHPWARKIMDQVPLERAGDE